MNGDNAGAVTQQRSEQRSYGNLITFRLLVVARIPVMLPTFLL